MASDDGTGEEEGVREVAVAFGVVEVGEGAIFSFPFSVSTGPQKLGGKNALTGHSLIDPDRHALEDGGAHFRAHDGGGEELPIRLGIEVSAVERETVFLPHDVVPVALHLVDVLGHEARFAAVVVAVAVAWLERLLAAHE